MTRVYGKQSVKPVAAAMCFAASSSPSKSERSRTSDAPSDTVATPQKLIDFTIHSSKSSEELRRLSEDFVQKVASLSLDQSASPKDRPQRRAALADRNTNAICLRPQKPGNSGETPPKEQVIEDSKLIASQIRLDLQQHRDGYARNARTASRSSEGANEIIPRGSGLDSEAFMAVPATDAPIEVDCDFDDWHPNNCSEAEDDDDLPHIRCLLDLIHDAQASKGPISFYKWSNSLTEHLEISKIAEASFGEVYRLSLAHPEPSLEDTAESVLKVIALKPESITHAQSGKKWTKSQQERIDSMSNPTDVASESRLLQRMRDVPGFANFRSLLIAQGPLPAAFLTAWRDYNENVRTSEFPDPGKRGSGYLGDEQLWAVLEMEDAGNDLEEKEVPDIWTLWDVFWGVTISLAKGEEWAGYEHRDLHLGNVCVRRPADHSIDTSKKLGSTGLETTLIDYTLSRANLADQDQAEDVAFFDLSTDPAIFQGDAADDYQYAIYRHMRGAVLQNDPCVTTSPTRPKAPRKRNRARPSLDTASLTGGPWRAHNPLTNLVWLHFVLYKLSEQLARWPSSDKRGRGRKKRTAEEQEVHNKALELEDMVLELTDMLELEGLVAGGLGSAAGLVAWAIEHGWLDEADVLGADTVGEEGSFLSIVQGMRAVQLEDEDSGSDVIFSGRRGARRG